MPTVPRLPFVPDVLRRIRVPKDLDSVTTAGEEAPAGGELGAGVEKIWESALSFYRSGVHPALQVCVWHRGEVVLNRAIGHARGNGPDDPEDAEKVPATTHTPFTVYSASKAITAFVVHKQVERGLIALDDPICKFVPEYDCNNKGEITVGQVLSHRAGVPNLPREALSLEYVGDRDYLVRALCEAKPFAAPGKRLAYHAISGGFILGEVVHRVTGKDIRTVLAEDFLDPLGFRWTNYGVAPEDVDQVGTDYSTGAPILPPLSTFLTRALGVHPDEVVRDRERARFRTAIVPAGNVATNAYELSKFFEVMRCGGELDGVRVIEPGTIRTALEEQSHLEIDLSLGFPTRFSYGLMLGARVLSLYGRDTQHAFGHLGYINILGWADPERALAAAIVTSGKPVVYPEMTRFLGLSQLITSEAPKVDPDELLI